jgi:hypothetical protein
MGDHTRPLHAFDETVHVPLIVRHPKQIPVGKRSDLLVSNYDLLPTLLDYLGAKDKTPQKPALAGRSFAGILRGQDVKWHNVVFYEFENTRAIRTAEWKYIERFPKGPNELYDLKKDPGQRKNVVDEAAHAKLQAQLRRELSDFFTRYAEPRYDLWKDGGSQAPLLTRPGGEEIVRRRQIATGSRPRFLAQQRPKARLHEVVIGGESLEDPALLHDHEGDAVDERPIFVGARSE